MLLDADTENLFSMYDRPGNRPLCGSARLDSAAEFLQLKEPMHEVLADFIHGCSPDSATRTVAATALVLSLWQLQGRAFTPEVPSLLLLHAGSLRTIPLTSSSGMLFTTRRRTNRGCNIRGRSSMPQLSSLRRR